MSAVSVSELPVDYDVVILPDGTQQLRERQTKAQVKIQALQVKNRNKKFRQKLSLLSGSGGDSPIAANSNESTAIQRQMLVTTDKATECLKNNSADEEHHSRWSAFKALGAKVFNPRTVE